MEALKRGLIAAAVAVGAVLPLAVDALDAAALQQLVRQAQFWETRNRPDLAREAWTRVIEADPDNVQALERLIELEARHGSAQKAAEYEARLRRLAPDSPVFQRRAQGLGAADRETALAQARSLARSGRSAEAIAAWRPLLDAQGEPPAALAVEYYETLAGTEDGWARARDALARLSTARPEDRQAALAYARVLSYRAATRREAIRRLEALGDASSPVRAEARRALRQALLWLDAGLQDRALYERYLRSVGDDAELRAKLDGLQAAARARERAAADARRAEALRAGYEALDADALDAAELFFSNRLNTSPNEADSLAGLGLVRLRQQRFAEAENLLGRAIAARPSLRASLTEALDTSRYWRRVSEARAAQQAGQWREAARRFAAAVELRPDGDADVRAATTRALRKAGDAQQAERILREGLRRKPGDPALVGEYAELLLAQQREAELDALLAEADRRDPSMLREVRAALLRTRAARARDAGDRTAAERWLQQALAADPQSPWVRLELARLYRDMGRSVEADSLLQALSEMPVGESDDAVLVQAYALADAQRWYETLIVLERLPPSKRSVDAADLQKRAWIQYQLQRAEQAAALGEPGRAVEILNAAIAAAGRGPDHASAIAKGWQALGDPARAVAALRRAFAQRPPTPGQSIQYAALLLELNQDAEFEAVTTSLIQSGKTSSAERRELEDLIVGYRIKLADRLREQGDIAAAYTQLREVVQRYPEQPRVQSALARLFTAAGDVDQALAIGRALLRDQSEDPRAWADAIDAALAANDRETAQAWIEQARRRYPEDPAFLRAAARLAEQQGQRARSLRLLREAAALEDRARAESAAPELMLIAADGSARNGLPQPVFDLLQEGGAESVGPLLPRAGDAGPSAAPMPLRVQRYRLDGALGARATETPARPAASIRRPLQLRLDHGDPDAAARPWPGRRAPRSIAPTLDETMQRLETSLGPWGAASFASRSRRGESGLSRLLAIETPFDLASQEWELGRLGLRVKPVVLDAGTVSGLRNKLRFGTLALINGESGDLDQSADGIALSLGWRIGEFAADIGTTPLGFDVESLVGGLRWQTRIGQAAQLAFEFASRPVTDSFLSYAGAYDPLTGKTWGGVVRSGGRLDYAYDLDRYGLYLNGAYYALGGRNVEENSVLELGGGLFFRLLREARHGNLTVGVNVTNFGYDKNLRHFTFGHGGYFSPQFFTTVALPLTWTGHRGRLDYRLEAAFGLQSFREDGAPLFPGRASLQQELEEIVEFEPINEIPLGYAAQKNSGLAYKFGGALQYRVNAQLSVGGLLSLDNARDYEESIAQVYLRYDFAGRSAEPGVLLLPELTRGTLP
ncbi:cellulose biosynthesis protein BcsC [Sinimarinibacterium thermocellulolyticum]|uniref:Cellulose synthase subunit BcsC-related outer membrane protein n=1 Tax=Sinimarinibacterium thermocellulolyticum TaxID=3170016 RepID=A0ABV2A984_9GAMM